MLETDRLIIRKFTSKDLEALFSILSDEEVNKYLPWFTIKTLEEAKVFLYERYINFDFDINSYKYAVCRKENNIPIGYINFYNNEDDNDFGYAIKKEYWNMGIITEACNRVILELKNNNIKYITATHDINNIASGKIMNKIGMNYCYTYEELWQPKNIKVFFRMYQLNLDGVKNRVYKGYMNKYQKSMLLSALF